MLFATRNGALKIVKEQLVDVGQVENGVIAAASASENVATAFPKSFADAIKFDVYPCDKNSQCSARLLIGREPAQKKVVLGKLTSDAEGEIHRIYAVSRASFQ